MGKEDLLQYALDHGIIDLANIRAEAEMNKREEILSNHPNKVWQGKDGKWRTYIHAEGYPKNLRLVCKTTKEALEDAIVGAYEEAENVHTFEEIFKEWNNHRLNNNIISPRSYLIYEETFKRFFKDNPLRTKDISKINVVEWQDFLESIGSCTGKSQFSTLKTIVKNVLLRAKKSIIIDISVTDIFETLEVNRKNKNDKIDDSQEVYTDAEFLIIEDYICANPNLNNLVILLIFVSGLRIGELCALEYDDITDYVIRVNKTVSKRTLELNTVHYEKYIKDSPKTYAGIRDIPIPTDYHWLIDKIMSFKNKDSKYIYGKDCNSVRSALIKICNNCGITYKKIHKIRKTYCSTLLDNNVNPKIVAKLAGHNNSLITVTVYNKDKTNDEEKKECVNSVFNKNKKDA